MSWKIVPVHRVAHIEPALNSGSIASGYARGAVRTLNPNHIVQGNTPDWVFDRGTGTKNPINAMVLVNHNGGSQTSTITAYHGASSPPAASIGAIGPSSNTSIYKALTSSDERYIRVVATGAAFEAGCISLGTAYDLGNPKFGGSGSHAPSDSPMQGGGRTLSLTFGGVTTANCKIIQRLLAVKYDIEGGAYDGMGGNGGLANVALVDGSDYVYWGRVQFDYSEYSPTLSRVTVQMTEAAYFRNV